MRNKSYLIFTCVVGTIGIFASYFIFLKFGFVVAALFAMLVVSTLLIIKFPVISICLYFAFIIIIGNNLMTNIEFIGGQLPINYLLIVFFFPPAIINQIINKGDNKIHFSSIQYFFMFLFIIALWGMSGLINNNEFELIRKESSIFFLIPVLYLWSSMVIEKESDIVAIIFSILIATSIASLKVMYLLSHGIATLSGEDSLLMNWQAYSTLGPQFGMQRIVLVGADTYFTITIPIIIMLLVTNKHSKYLMMIILILTSMGLLFSYTRSNWVAGILAALIVAIYSIKKKVITSYKFVYYLLALAIILYLVHNLQIGKNGYNLYEGFQRRMSFDPTKGSGVIQPRLVEAQEVIEEVGSSFLFGKGMGATFMSSLIGYETYWSHSAITTFYLKSGIIGIYIIALFLIRIMFKINRYITGNGKDMNSNSILIGISGSVIALLIMSITNNRLFSMESTTYLGVFIAMVQYITNQYKKA